MTLAARSTLIGAIAVAVIAIGLSIAPPLVSRSAGDGKGVLASLLSRVLSTSTTRVSIGRVDGAFSSDVTVHDIAISDRDGVWLRLDKARLVWSRAALLLHQRLEVDKLEVGTLQVLRRPLPSEEVVADGDQPILPQLPVKVAIKSFTLHELSLGAPVVGEAARLSATGATTLGDPAEGLDLKFDAKRLDAAGSLTAQLTLVPKSNRLTLKLAAQEPAAGLVVHALNVPGLPPVSLDLNGTGTLDAFVAQLAFDAGSEIGATGSARVQRAADTRRLTLDLKARIAGLLPTPAAPVFAGTTQLNGTIDFADSGAIAIKPITVELQTARLDVQGTLSPEQVADLTISAKARDNAGGKTAAGGAEIGKLAFDAIVAGPIMRPRIEAKVDAADVSVPQGTLKALKARFATAPAANVEPIPFTVRAQASGVALRDTGLALALGDSFTLAADGSLDKGIADFRVAQLRTSTADIGFAGRIGEPELHGRLTVRAPDLTRFSELAELKLRGTLDLSASFSGVPKDGRIEAMLDGRAEKFATGIAAIDGLAGGRVALNGRVRKLAHGGFGFDNLRLTAVHANARADGEATAETAGIDVHLVIPELKHADKRLSGHAEAALRLTGSLTQPNAAFAVTVTDGSGLGRSIPRLALDATVTDLTGNLIARAKLSGSVGGKPAEGAFRLAKLAQGGWRLDDLGLQVGSVTARGAVNLTDYYFASGRLVIDARDLDDISPLALTKMSGSLHADATLTVSDGGQSGSLSAQGGAIKFGELDARPAYRRFARDRPLPSSPHRRRTRHRSRALRRRRHLARTPDRARCRFGKRDRAHGAPRGFAIDARGNLYASPDIRLELGMLTARRDRHSIALAHPATLTFRDGGVEAKSLLLALDRGRLGINGRIGDTLDVEVQAEALPLAASETVIPGLGLSGTLTGNAKIAGMVSSPTGAWRLRIDRLVTAQTRDKGLPAIDIAASGRLADHRTSLDATLRAAGAGTVQVKGTVPLQGEGLDLAVRGPIDLGAVNETLSASGRRVSGKADINMRLRGSITRPKVDGTARIAGGGYSDAALGIRLSEIAGQISARGDDIRIDRLSAKTWDTGTISAQGRVRIAPDAGFPGDITISSRNAKLVANDVVTAVANLSLTLSGPLARDPRIGGRIDVVSLDVAIPERLPTTLQPIAGTEHVDAPPEAAALLEQRAKVEARARRGPPFDAALDLAISAPNRVFVRGRGIDSELGGELRLRGRLSDPVTVGAFELRRGRMSVAGTRLDFTQGRLTFAGSLTPELNFVAQTQTTDAIVTITITGPATRPSFAFSSDPTLPPEEVLSRLLFAKASGGLSPGQALQVAQVAAQFSGGGGTDVFERVRRALGVDSIDVSLGSNGDPKLGISRAINRRISVGVKAGAQPEDSGVSVDIDVTRHLRAQGEVSRNGNTAVGIGMEWEY